MSLRKKYEQLKCSYEYNNTIISYVTNFLLDNTFTMIKDFKCNGLGECYDNIPGTYIYYKRSDKCDCKLKACPNFILCENYVPQITLDSYYGLCYHCSLAYKMCGIGRGKLEVFEDTLCINCNKITTCIQQAYCNHIICLECFKLAHFKPGTDECPVCNINRDKYIILQTPEDNYHKI